MLDRSPSPDEERQPLTRSVEPDNASEDESGESNIKTSPVVDGFSTTEKLVMEEFLREVPGILKEVYGESGDQRPFTIWGVEVTDIHSPLAKGIYIKFIRGRYLSVRDAREMMITVLKWRQSDEFRKCMKALEPNHQNGTWHELDKMKISDIDGKDRGGRPVVYNYWGNVKWDELFKDAKDKEDREQVREDFLRWRIAFMEKCAKELDYLSVDRFLQVHDYANIPFGSRNKNARKTAEMVTNHIFDYYPDFLHWKIMVNVPAPLPFIFWLGKLTWMSYQVYDKVDVVGRDAESIRKKLEEYVTESRYGVGSNTHVVREKGLGLSPV
ncbi:hypothetical protein AX16_001771 [Volvariella volvacea WC 439]|nr:hypothetical protein AX16_001771 [Volvariella volvacea WC 439]